MHGVKLFLFILCFKLWGLKVSVLEELEKYKQKFPQEQEVVVKFIEFVAKNGLSSFDSSFPLGHLTASAWVLSPNAHKVLLTHHKKLDKWLQLGGHADGQTDMLQVALREVCEEVGFE